MLPTLAKLYIQSRNTLHMLTRNLQDLEELYQQTAWKLEKKFGTGPASSYDIFKMAIT